MTINTLAIFGDEFKQRNFFDWIISHTSLSLPPHRYKGEIEITDNIIKFTGMDTKLNADSEFIIRKDDIEQVYFGYDEIFNIYQTRGFGLSWAPVRIKYTDIEEHERFVYFIAGYDKWSSANKDFYNFLTEWLS